MVNKKNILFFADRLPPLIGGMEMHACYFLKYFENHYEFPLLAVITKDVNGKNIIFSKKDNIVIDISKLPELYSPMFIFFNSGRWIEEFKEIRKAFPKAYFIYRTGGNEILKAPLIKKKISEHSLRQAYWVKIINNYIDVLITNSFYTEERLCKLGIVTQFIRCVGGVNISALKESKTLSKTSITIFCAARFVPYKNHKLLIAVIHKLKLCGYNIKVKLAGDGPLLKQVKDLVFKYNLDSVVEFLGVLDNDVVYREIANSHIYMQLSSDYITQVSGGSYIHSEGMGRSILEAITVGTFVIAGKSGALSEIVTKDRGILVEPNNIEQIVNNILPILKTMPIAKLECTDKFSWDKVFVNYEKLFKSFNESIISNGEI
jgi:glycosyltransferase involved in cell wall biosynthesis